MKKYNKISVLVAIAAIAMMRFAVLGYINRSITVEVTRDVTISKILHSLGDTYIVSSESHLLEFKMVFGYLFFTFYSLTFCIFLC